MTGRSRVLAIVGLPLAVLLAMVLASCERSDPQPDASSDANAETFRLAVLSPALSATLVKMGMGDLIVARHAYDMVLDSSVPSAGDERALDAEALIRSRPTHVLIDEMSRESLAYVQELAEKSGWEVHSYDLRTLDLIAQSARDLRDQFAPGDATAANAIEEFQRAIARRDIGFNGRLLLLAQTNPPGAIGPASFHGEILDRFGVRNALADGDRWQELDAEDVLHLAPDAIIVIRWHSPGEISDSSLDSKDLRAALGSLSELDISALREGRVAVIDDPLALTPSLAMGDFATRLAEILESFDD